MRATLIVFLCSAFLAVGCKQGIGDRCVQNSDCSSGFCSSNGGNPQGGTCRSTSAVPDASVSTTGGGGAGGEAGQAGEAGQGGEAGQAGEAGQGGEAGQAGSDAAVSDAAVSDAASASDALPGG